jgi:hypothetical protein
METSSGCFAKLQLKACDHAGELSKHIPKPKLKPKPKPKRAIASKLLCVSQSYASFSKAATPQIRRAVSTEKHL